MKRLVSKKKVFVTLIAVMIMVCATSTVAFASWYGFNSKKVLAQHAETTVYQAEYDGNNVGADIWISWNTSYSKPASPQIEFIIEKKSWLGWKTVAHVKQSINNQCTVKAWDVGSGTYRFRVYNPFSYGEMYATKFESYSW